MKSRISLMLLLATASLCLAPSAFAQTVEYLLVPTSATLAPTDEGMVVGTNGYSLTTTSCSATTDQYGNVITDLNFSGTAYETDLRLFQSGSHQPSNLSVYVMQQPLSRGTRLTGFTLLNNGEVCTENINGVPYQFQKYQAVTCTHCGRPTPPHQPARPTPSPFRHQH